MPPDPLNPIIKREDLVKKQLNHAEREDVVRAIAHVAKVLENSLSLPVRFPAKDFGPTPGVRQEVVKAIKASHYPVRYDADKMEYEVQ
jgi:hypothetical protein